MQQSTHLASPPINVQTSLIWEPTKTAHRQNGPNEGRKRPPQTKTAPTKTAPMEDQNGPS